MSAAEFIPCDVPDELAPVVSAVWYLRAAPAHRFEKVLPTTRAHLIVNLSGPYEQLRRGAESTGIALHGAFFAGLQTQYLINKNPSELRMLVAQITPEGVGLVTAPSRSRHVDEVLPADHVVPGIADIVEDGRRGAPPDALLSRLLQLLRLRVAARVPDSLVSRARLALEAQPPVTIAGLARAEGVPARMLSDRFSRVCGVTPKRFSEVARFASLLTSLAARNPLPTWTELVAEYGYYDQPHVTRAFTRFAGRPPARFVRDLRDHGLEYATFVPLEELGDEHIAP